MSAQVLAVVVRVLSARVGVSVRAHCQVGFAVMFIIGGISFLRRYEKSPIPVRARALAGVYDRIIYVRNRCRFRGGRVSEIGSIRLPCRWLQLIHLLDFSVRRIIF